VGKFSFPNFVGLFHFPAIVESIEASRTRSDWEGGQGSCPGPDHIERDACGCLCRLDGGFVHIAAATPVVKIG
jgi:hypothetical protein